MDTNMNCITCGHPLDSSKAGFVVCPHCGTVNLPQTVAQAAPITISNRRHTPVRKHLTARLFRHKIAVLAVCTVLVLFIIGTLGYQNHQASAKLAAAKISISKGNYQVALQSLDKAKSYFSFGSIKKQISSLQAKDSRWVIDESELQQAAILVNNGKLNDASLLIKRIGTDFPEYAKVKALLGVIQAKELALQQANKPVAPTAKAATTAPTPKKTTSSRPGLCYQIGGRGSRSGADLPDDTSGYQLHIVYVIPSDGTDHQYDVNGAIATSVSAWENWLCGQTSGRVLKLDTYHGALDTTFVRLNASDNTIMTGSDLPYSTNPNNNPYVREDIEIHLKQLGFTDSHKLYAVYYDGTSNYSCGGGAWPPTVSGHVAAEYMHGGQPGWPVPCQSNHLATSITSPGYFDFDILHETMHTLGFVSSCSAHFTASGHVSDSNTDLMYSGSQPWYPSVLDINHNDYYNPTHPNCFDLSNSTFLTGSGSQLPPNW